MWQMIYWFDRKQPLIKLEIMLTFEIPYQSYTQLKGIYVPPSTYIWNDVIHINNNKAQNHVTYLFHWTIRYF